MHRTTEELEGLLPGILEAPKDNGRTELIVRRPGEGTRQVVDTAQLDRTVGLVGDNWALRGSTSPETQLTLMNSRVIEAMAQDRADWPLAGDQIYLDMDISTENLPAGSRLTLGDAIVEISNVPHTGCGKFADRFGKEALRFANVV